MIYRIIFYFLLSASVLRSHVRCRHQYESSQAYWENSAQELLKANLERKANLNIAKNLVFFLGDGMSLSTVAAARILKGQKNDKPGEEESLTFEKFPYLSLAKTYALDKQVSDSACTATAYLCGVKANYGTLGLDGRVKQNDCITSKNKSTHVSSILQWAQEAGKSTGFVTTTRVTHASPAGLYSHTASREWESNSDNPECPDIAKQLVTMEPGKNIQVIMGGGRCKFLNESEKNARCGQGDRKDGRNLINEWLRDKKSRNLKATYVTDTQRLSQIDINSIDYLLGLFNFDHMNYEVERPKGPSGEPSIAEMTKVAIEILKKNPRGFFLFVEGGRIDLAHHENRALKALEDTLAFDRAVEMALKLTSQDDTLILVTADHSHTMTINGYPERGNDIMGIAGVSDIDNLTYSTLSYANGPGSKGRQENLTEADISGVDYMQDALVPLNYETHGGDDVGVHAIGPMAHLFQGIHEQSYIPYVLGYASCIGKNLDHCESSSSMRLSSIYITFFSYFIKQFFL